MNTRTYVRLGWGGGHNRHPGAASWFKLRRHRWFRRGTRRWLRRVKQEEGT